MSSQPREKPKGLPRRPPHWWLLLPIAFGLGVVVTLIIVQSSPPAQSDGSPLQAAYGLDALVSTATALALEGERSAINASTVPPFDATATAIIVGATQQAVMTAIDAGS